MVKETWGNYFYYFLAISVLYSPVLGYSFFRNSGIQKLPNWLGSLLWFYCFIVHSFLIIVLKNTYFEWLFPADNYMHGNEDKRAFGISFGYTIGLSVLATEISIQFSGNLRQWLASKKWWQRLGLDQLLLLLVIFLSLLFSLPLNLGKIKGLDGLDNSNIFLAVGQSIYYCTQFFLILMVYYSFYFVNKKYLIPYFLSKKGIVHYGFMVVLTILITYPILTQFMRLLPLYPFIFDTSYSFIQPFHFDRGLLPVFVMILSVPVVVALQWFEQNNQIANLEKEKSATELNLLKQQINPHFFFNTLNNLYALSIVKDKQTPEVIMQLSELMRYVIYKGKEETVALAEEVKYIEDYVQLQQIRLHKKLDFKFEKDIENERLKIPPLLFITFVENAFKHGIEPAENDCFLHLSLKSDGRQLIFSCENSVEEKNTAPAGIGLENLRRRMELRFPDAHELTATEGVDTYQGSLTLTLPTYFFQPQKA